jgi:hypothetical protein
MQGIQGDLLIKKNLNYFFLFFYVLLLSFKTIIFLNTKINYKHGEYNENN